MTDYQDYLALDTLLDLQRPRVPATEGPRVHAAEHFFIIVHQASELWVAQLLLDLDHATTTLRDGQYDTATEHLERAAAAVGVLFAHIRSLDHLPATCFTRFRPHLGTASGAQSRQFAALEAALGLGPQESPVAAALAEARTHPDAPLTRAIAALTHLATGYRDWKIAHLSLVTRVLGPLPGTGGTTGADWLATRIRAPFPDLLTTPAPLPVG